SPTVAASWGGDRGAGAVGADPEQLEPLRVHAVAGARLDLAGDGIEPELGHVGRAPAARAHDVVVVRARALDVGVVAVGEVDALDDAEVEEEVDRAEDRRAADPK